MCILLERTYSCWENDAWRQHSYSYLNRCANPRYAECIQPDALGVVKENYDIACPSCTKRFFQTRRSPVRIATNLNSINENGPQAQAAAQEYAKSLIEFLIMAFTSADPVFEDTDDQRAFRVCKMETACRFDKDHFDNGAFCQGTHCEDPKQKEHFEDIPTNTWPELHNISAAMRRVVSQGYLLLAQDSGLSDARARAVAEILVHVWVVNPIARGKLVGPALLGLFEKVLDAGRKAVKDRLYNFAGDMLATDAGLKFTQYYFMRNRELWLLNEYARQHAIESTVEPLGEQEIDHLRAAVPDDMDCVACGEEMAHPPDAHAAVRLKCGAGHMIGMKCWTRALRRKKWVEMDGIKCHSCADKILGPWKMPMNLHVVDAYDVANTPPLDLYVPDVIQL
ncbi:hypothetical protein CSPAE12_00339 [Colletotrichum incanum]|nr:hypothetical protein CSPAE12_00339 [Colletotrichum incanum]